MNGCDVESFDIVFDLVSGTLEYLQLNGSHYVVGNALRKMFGFQWCTSFMRRRLGQHISLQTQIINACLVELHLPCFAVFVLALADIEAMP